MFFSNGARRNVKEMTDFVNRKVEYLLHRGLIAPQDAEDISQELQLRMWRWLRRRRGQEIDRRIIVRAMYQRMLRILRKRRNGNAIRLDQSQESDEGNQAATELMLDCETILNYLPADLRELAEDLKANGTLRGASQRLGISKKELRARLIKLRNALWTLRE